MTSRHVWRPPGQEPSKLPPVRIGEAWYDADTCAEIQRLIDEHDARDDGLTEDRMMMLEYGQTPHELLDSTGLTNEEILEQFGAERDELAASLGMPSREELIIFKHLRAEKHALQSQLD
ncbi:MAG: hypothetical protein OXH19_12450 [Chloroflexi bacterium]|nr:hypothetical protein [Chloroflexota bacterium]MCY3589558.1 hypothetical protein [Chloroflexota bacterium]MCY3685846.1 hypothetical protein [Chloroflexota bacterium]MDE2709614.1 hypothetical protein [Chloroflexota bacterium]